MASFYIPLTGLNADSTALNTIANDLSNMNTTGYKAHTVNFSDLFSQQLGSTGSGDPLQVGAGTQVASITTDFSNGSPDSTGVDTNVALQGSGFFVVSDGQNQYLTRAGNFAVDATGNLITPNGLTVMGYPAANGVINTNAPIAPINVPESEVLSPAATSTFNIAANLDSTAALNSTFPATVNIYDSLGQMHTATVTFTNTGVNQWSYSVQIPAADTGGVAAPVNGTMTFDASGDLATVNGTAVGTGAGQVSSIAVAIPGLTDQAANLNMSWNLMGTGGTPSISQVASQSAVDGTTQDGYASGQYQGFTIGSDGTVTVTFSNDQKQNVGQIALGNVANLQGLRDAGNSDYATTMASGTTTVGVSGSAGLGTMQDGALEASNVNISAEFSNLIIAQRAFEANSKSITTFDTITQETIQMIH